MRPEDLSNSEPAPQHRLFFYERWVVNWIERRKVDARQRLIYGPEGTRLLYASRANLLIAWLIGFFVVPIRFFVSGGPEWLVASSPILAMAVVLFGIWMVRAIQFARVSKAFRENRPW